MAQAKRQRTRSTVRAPRARAKDDARQTEARQAGPAPLCSVGLCPICLAVTALGDVRPELMEHLVAAGREFLLAARALIDARLEDEPGQGRLERLTIE
jgi:hypothetical protein